MSLIVAARFETFEAAEVAARALMNIGVTEDELNTFFVTPRGAHDRYPVGGDRAADPLAKGAPYSAIGGAALLGLVGAVVGAVITLTFSDSILPIVGGAGVGAYIGSLAGAMFSMGKGRPNQSPKEALEEANQGRHAGVVLAVHTAPQSERQIATILREAGGVEVERAQGTWRNGQWTDFDPLSTPDLEKEV